MNLRVAIIDCGAGNLHSVRKAFARQLPDGGELAVVREASALADATHIVLPGVGAFADCMAGLNSLPGMREALEARVRYAGVPFFGICVGMQMLFARGHEHGVYDGLGWLSGEVKPLAPADSRLRIPHMGWNTLRPTRTHPLLQGLGDAPMVYFVHSFAAMGAAPHDVLAEVDYGGPVVALIARDNMLGAQFHPEKSQRAGLQLLSNFLAMV